MQDAIIANLLIMFPRITSTDDRVRDRFSATARFIESGTTGQIEHEAPKDRWWISPLTTFAVTVLAGLALAWLTGLLPHATIVAGHG